VARINAAERPHITLAYGIGDADSGAFQSRLRRATDQRCHLTLTHLGWVDVTQDRIAHGYR
jgi:2'-5' RNA ligase